MTVAPSPLAAANATVGPYVAPPQTTYAGTIGTANAAVEPTRQVLFWRIDGEGKRQPLFARGPLGPGQARRALVAGEFFPDVSTTGVYDESVLEVVTGNQTITTSGATIENKHFRGRVDVRATGVTFRNCLFTGPPSSAQGNAILVATSVLQSGLLIEDCTIAPEHTSHITNCIEGHHFTLRRVNSYHGVDLCSVIAPAGTERADVVIEGSWLHDPVMFNTPTQPDNLTHNDVVQWHGMKGLTINGSRLEGFCAPSLGIAPNPPVGAWPNSLTSGNPFHPNAWASGAVVMASPLRAQFGDFTFTNNWLTGAAVGLNLTRDPVGGFPDCGTITGNKFGTGWRLGADFGVLAKAAQTMLLEGNCRWNPGDPFDESTPFNIRKAG